MATACSDDRSQAGADESGDRFEYVMSRAFEDAEQVGASREQTEILEQARQEGEVSFELYNQDRARFEPHREAIVDCATREGIDIDPDGDIIEIVVATWEAYDLGQTDVDCTEGTW